MTKFLWFCYYITVELVKTLIRSISNDIDFDYIIKKATQNFVVEKQKESAQGLTIGDYFQILNGNLLQTGVEQPFVFKINLKSLSPQQEQLTFIVKDENNNAIYQETFTREQAQNKIIQVNLTPPITISLLDRDLKVLFSSKDIEKQLTVLNQQFYAKIYDTNGNDYEVYLFLRRNSEILIIPNHRTIQTNEPLPLSVNDVVDVVLYNGNNIIGFYNQKPSLSNIKFSQSYAFLSEETRTKVSPLTILLYHALSNFVNKKINNFESIDSINISDFLSSNKKLKKLYRYNKITETYNPIGQEYDIFETLLASYFLVKHRFLLNAELFDFITEFINEIISFTAQIYYPNPNPNIYVIPNEISNNPETYYLGTNLLYLEVLDALNYTNEKNLLKTEIENVFISQNKVKVGIGNPNSIDAAIAKKLLENHFSQHQNYLTISNQLDLLIPTPTFNISSINKNYNINSNDFNPDIEKALTNLITLRSKNLFEEILYRYFLGEKIDVLIDLSDNEKMILDSLEFSVSDNKFISPSAKNSLLFYLIWLIQNVDPSPPLGRENEITLLRQDYTVIGNTIIKYTVEFSEPTKSLLIVLIHNTPIKFFVSSNTSFAHEFYIDISQIPNPNNLNFQVFSIA